MHVTNENYYLNFCIPFSVSSVRGKTWWKLESIRHAKSSLLFQNQMVRTQALELSPARSDRIFLFINHKSHLAVFVELVHLSLTSFIGWSVRLRIVVRAAWVPVNCWFIHSSISSFIGLSVRLWIIGSSSLSPCQYCWSILSNSNGHSRQRIANSLCRYSIKLVLRSL